MNKRILKICSMLVGLCLSVSVWAGNVAVIVNKDNNNAIDAALVAKIYTGEVKSWPGGGRVVTLDLPENDPTRISFSTDMIGKSVANLKSIWAQMMFSGTAVPPKVLPSDDAVKKMVSSNKNAIGYISASSLDGTVKAVLK